MNGCLMPWLIDAWLLYLHLIYIILLFGVSRWGNFFVIIWSFLHLCYYFIIILLLYSFSYLLSFLYVRVTLAIMFLFLAFANNHILPNSDLSICWTPPNLSPHPFILSLGVNVGGVEKNVRKPCIRFSTIVLLGLVEPKMIPKGS